MHIVLTGSIQVGKSTALRKALQALNMPICGFETRFADARGREGSRLLMQRAGAPPENEAESTVARFMEGRMVAFPERFDAIGCALLNNPNPTARLILMDECGYLEKDALGFRQAVLRALDGKRPVLGVVRQGAGGWTGQILQHPKVRLLTVTEQNRAFVPERIIRHVREMEASDAQHD